MTSDNDEGPRQGTGASHGTATEAFATLSVGQSIDLRAISGDSTNPRYEVFLHGWATGWESRQPEIDRLNWDLDRRYVAMYNPPRIDPSQPTYAELLRRRGDPERAAMVEADLAAMFREVRR